MVSVVYSVANVAFCHAAETNFWSTRLAAARQAGPSRGASAPKTSDALILAQLPGGARLDFPGPMESSVVPTVPLEHLVGGKTPVFESDLPRWLADVVAPFGNMRDVFLSKQPGAPLVIHIQDLHDSTEAQRNIAGLVEALQDQRGVSLVGLEGAQGGFATEAFRSFPDGDLTKAVAEHFMEEGYLGGPEFAGITAKRMPLLWGVEDLRAYEANVASVKASAKNIPEVEVFLREARRVMGEVKKRRLSLPLLEFDRHLTGYHSRTEPLGSYTRYLLHRSRVPPDKVPNLILLRDALDWEETLDFKKIEAERAALLNRMVGGLSKENLDRLVARSVLYRLARISYGDYYRFLRSLCVESGIRLDDFDQLSAYVRYVLLAERINRNNLLLELSGLEREVQDGLAVTPEEKEVVGAARHLALLERLVRHAFTPADWVYHLSHEADIRGVGKTIVSLAEQTGVPNDLSPPAPETLQPFEEFCLQALGRNGALVQNLLDKMKMENRPTAVLVAGGFHTEGLTQLFRQKDVSYAVVTPKINATLPDGTRSLELLARDPAPLEKLFAGETLNIPTPRMMAEGNAGFGLVKKMSVYFGATLLALLVAATNVAPSARATESVEAFPGITRVDVRRSGPSEVLSRFELDNGASVPVRSFVGVKGAVPPFAPVVTATFQDRSVSLAPAIGISFEERLRGAWEGALSFAAGVGTLVRGRRAKTSTVGLDLSPYAAGIDPWGSKAEGDQAILSLVSSEASDGYVASGDFDLTGNVNLSFGKTTIGSITESESGDLLASQGSSLFWEERAVLAAAVGSVGGNIYAGAGGDEFRIVISGADAKERLAIATADFNAHFVGRYAFFHLSHPHPDAEDVQTELKEKVRSFAQNRATAEESNPTFRLVRFGDGFSLVLRREGTTPLTSRGLQDALGLERGVRERKVERLGLSPFTVSMGAVPVSMAREALALVGGNEDVAEVDRQVLPAELMVWVQRFANDALGFAKRARNRVYSPADLPALQRILKAGSLTKDHREALRKELSNPATMTSHSPAGPGVLSRGDFWAETGKRLEVRPGEPWKPSLDLYYFSITQYSPGSMGRVERWWAAHADKIPASLRRFLPETWFRRLVVFIQARAFHLFQGSNYERGNRAIRTVVDAVKTWAKRGRFTWSTVLIGNSVDNVFVARSRQLGEDPLSTVGFADMARSIKNRLNASESTSEIDPHLLVFHVSSGDLKNLPGNSLAGALDLMGRTADLLEVHAREAAGYMGKGLDQDRLVKSLEEIFDVQKGEKFVSLIFNPDKVEKLMAVYRQSQTEDSLRGESSLFSRAPAELGSALFRSYHWVLQKLGVGEHRARLWLGSRYVQGFVVPFVELIGLPGFAWVLAPYLGFALAVVLGSVAFSWIHGSPLSERGPPSRWSEMVGRQASKQFLVRLSAALAINALSLFMGTDQLSNLLQAALPAPDAATVGLTGYIAHSAWNLFVPEQFRLTLRKNGHGIKIDQEQDPLQRLLSGYAHHHPAPNSRRRQLDSNRLTKAYSALSAMYPPGEADQSFSIELAVAAAEFGAEINTVLAAFLGGYAKEKGAGHIPDDFQILSGMTLRDFSAAKTRAENWLSAMATPFPVYPESISMIRNQMGFFMQGAPARDKAPQEVLLLTLLGKTLWFDRDPDTWVEAEYLFSPLAERFGLDGLATDILNHLFEKEQPARYREVLTAFKELTGLDYYEAHTVLENFRYRLEGQLDSLLPDELKGKAKLVARVKGVASIAEKLERDGKGKNLSELTDLFGLTVVFPDGHRDHEVVRRALEKFKFSLNQEKTKLNHPEDHQYDFYRFVGGVSLRSGVRPSRQQTIELQVYDEKTWRLSKEGDAAHWIYNLQKRLGSQTVEIDDLSLTGNLQEDVRSFLNDKSESVFVSVVMGTEMGKPVCIPVRLQKGAFSKDAAAHRRIDRLNPGFLGLDLLTPSASPPSQWERIAWPNDQPLPPGAVFAIRRMTGRRVSLPRKIQGSMLRPRTRLMDFLASSENASGRGLATRGRILVQEELKIRNVKINNVVPVRQQGKFSQWKQSLRNLFSQGLEPDRENALLTPLARKQGFFDTEELFAYLGAIEGDPENLKEALGLVVSRLLDSHLEVETVFDQNSTPGFLVSAKYDRPGLEVAIRKVFKQFGFVVRGGVHRLGSQEGDKAKGVKQLYWVITPVDWNLLPEAAKAIRQIPDIPYEGKMMDLRLKIASPLGVGDHEKILEVLSHAAISFKNLTLPDASESRFVIDVSVPAGTQKMVREVLEKALPETDGYVIEIGSAELLASGTGSSMPVALFFGLPVLEPTLLSAAILGVILGLVFFRDDLRSPSEAWRFLKMRVSEWFSPSLGRSLVSRWAGAGGLVIFLLLVPGNVDLFAAGVLPFLALGMNEAGSPAPKPLGERVDSFMEGLRGHEGPAVLRAGLELVGSCGGVIDDLRTVRNAIRENAVRKAGSESGGMAAVGQISKIAEARLVLAEVKQLLRQWRRELNQNGAKIIFDKVRAQQQVDALGKKWLIVPLHGNMETAPAHMRRDLDPIHNLGRFLLNQAIEAITERQGEDRKKTDSLLKEALSDVDFAAKGILQAKFRTHSKVMVWNNLLTLDPAPLIEKGKNSGGLAAVLRFPASLGGHALFGRDFLTPLFLAAGANQGATDYVRALLRRLGVTWEPNQVEVDPARNWRDPKKGLFLLIAGEMFRVLRAAGYAVLAEDSDHRVAIESVLREIRLHKTAGVERFNIRVHVLRSLTAPVIGIHEKEFAFHVRGADDFFDIYVHEKTLDGWKASEKGEDYYRSALMVLFYHEWAESFGVSHAELERMGLTIEGLNLMFASGDSPDDIRVEIMQRGMLSMGMVEPDGRVLDVRSRAQAALALEAMVPKDLPRDVQGYVGTWQISEDLGLVSKQNLEALRNSLPGQGKDTYARFQSGKPTPEIDTMLDGFHSNDVDSLESGVRLEAERLDQKEQKLVDELARDILARVKGVLSAEGGRTMARAEPSYFQIKKELALIHALGGSLFLSFSRRDPSSRSVPPGLLRLYQERDLAWLDQLPFMNAPFGSLDREAILSSTRRTAEGYREIAETRHGLVGAFAALDESLLDESTTPVFRISQDLLEGQAPLTGPQRTALRELTALARRAAVDPTVAGRVAFLVDKGEGEALSSMEMLGRLETRLGIARGALGVLGAGRVLSNENLFEESVENGRTVRTYLAKKLFVLLEANGVPSKRVDIYSVPPTDTLAEVWDISGLNGTAGLVLRLIELWAGDVAIRVSSEYGVDFEKRMRAVKSSA